MSPAGFSKRWMGGAVAALLAFGIGVPLAARGSAEPQLALQRIADDAALAGVNALAASIGQPAEQRMKHSVAAAQAALAGQPGILRSLSGSAEALTLKVVLVAPTGGHAAVAEATYVPPSDGVAARDSAAGPAFLPGDRARM